MSTFGIQIVPMKYNPRDENSIKAVMAKANVVVNLIGLYNLLHVEAIFNEDLLGDSWIIFSIGREGVRNKKL